MPSSSRPTGPKLPTTVTYHAAKGGVGTSVVAAASAILAAESGPTLLVDLAGDQPHIFGSGSPSSSLSDWLRADNPHPDSLARLEHLVGNNLAVLAVEGTGCIPPADRLRALAQVLRADGRTVVVDLGRLGQAGIPLIQSADRSYLVTRPCYLAIRAARTSVRPDGIVLVSEKGRSLRSSDVSSALDAPVVVELWSDPAVSRAVDAGLLATRLPRSLRPLEGLR